MTGFQNQRLGDLDWWKYEYEKLEDMPMNDLANRMNHGLIHLGKDRKMSDYARSMWEMKKLLLE